MPKYYEGLISKLIKSPMSENEFETYLAHLGGLFSDVEIELELIKESGIPLLFSHDKVYFRPMLTSIKDECFCIVDIETNGHNPYVHQPIEIGAIKYQNGKVIDTFQSLIYAENIPEFITKITNITQEMLKNAPRIHQVLESFKIFLGDSIFVAHNVDFDFNFLSEAYNNLGFGRLYNPKVCTIKLAKKTIPSPKYSLSFLNENLKLGYKNLHRALRDCEVALEIFKISLKNLDKNIYSSYDLLKFLQTQKGRKNEL